MKIHRTSPMSPTGELNDIEPIGFRLNRRLLEIPPIPEPSFILRP